MSANGESAVLEYRWYAIHTYSGFENRVKQTIERRSVLEGWDAKISRVIIPLEAVIELKNTKKVTVMRNLMPGYVLIEMLPEDELFNIIKEIKGVSDFVGGGKPAPLSQAEIDNILNLIETKLERPKQEITYQKGDQVKVTEGPFANFIGMVDHVDHEKNKLAVMVSIFGRPTPVELDVMQVEPAS